MTRFFATAKWSNLCALTEIVKLRNRCASETCHPIYETFQKSQAVSVQPDALRQVRNCCTCTSNVFVYNNRA